MYVFQLDHFGKVRCPQQKCWEVKHFWTSILLTQGPIRKDKELHGYNQIFLYYIAIGSQALPWKHNCPGKKYDYHFIIHISLLFGTSNEVSNCFFFYVSFSTDVESWKKKLDRPHWAVLTLNEVRILLCTFKKLLCLVSGFNKNSLPNQFLDKTRCQPASRTIGEKSEKRWVVISITTTCFIPLQSCFQLLHAIQLTWYQ